MKKLFFLTDGLYIYSERERIIDGDNHGGKILIDDKSGNIEKEGSFNNILCKRKIFSSFCSFSKDSNGRINSLFNVE